MRSKFIATLLVTAFVFALVPAVVMGDEKDDEISRLNNVIDSLYNQINDIQNQVPPTPIPEPTPIPVTLPVVKLLSPSMINVRNGSAADVEIQVQNIGSSFANNLLTQATVTGEAPFTLEFLNSSNAVSSLYEGRVQKMRLRVRVDANAKAGAYPVTLTHSYRNVKNENFSETDTLTVKVLNDATAPKVVLDDFKTSAEVVRGGGEFSLSVQMRNRGTSIASDVQITIEGFDPAKIFLSGSSGSVYFRELDQGARQTLTYSLKAAPKIEQGSYPLTFKIKYRDAEAKEYTEEYTHYVIAAAEEEEEEKEDNESRAKLEITNMAAPDGVYEVGDDFEIIVDLKNSGIREAKNIKITAASTEADAVVPRTASIQTLAALDIGAETRMSFTFSPTNKARTQNYAISFKVEYETGVKDEEKRPEVFTFEQFAGVNVRHEEPEEEEEKDDSKISEPKIIIESYKCDPILVKAGQQFDLELVFQNTHKSKSIENIKATLTAVETTERKGSVFTPVDGSNTFYIDAIEPKGTAERKLKMFTVPDAPPRTYTIQISFKYQDREYNTYEDTDQIGINVKQVVDLETSDITIPPTTMAGEPVYVSFMLSNTGKSSLMNTRTRIEGDFDTSSSMLYFGTVAQSSTVYYDGQFIVPEPGTYTGRVLITYEDEMGEKFEREQPFSIEATAMDFGGELDFVPPESEPEGLAEKLLALVKRPVFYAWAGGGLAVLIVIILLVRKLFKKKQKGLDEDE
ncbi:MAG: hypothetical protein LBS62_01575 [Clostridiales bacterium]|jgi:hypothetical protein|nr:hypothetical protein [Clostridiales bacterium]